MPSTHQIISVSATTMTKTLNRARVEECLRLKPPNAMSNFQASLHRNRGSASWRSNFWRLQNTNCVPVNDMAKLYPKQQRHGPFATTAQPSFYARLRRTVQPNAAPITRTIMETHQYNDELAEELTADQTQVEEACDKFLADPRSIRYLQTDANQQGLLGFVVLPSKTGHLI